MSFPTAAELADFPGLIPWLAESAWKADFAPIALARDYESRVASIVLKEDGPDIDDYDDKCKLLIDAQVKASAPRPYRTRLYFFPNYNSQTRTMGVRMETECSCFQSIGCQHAVAVLENLTAISSITASDPRPRVNTALAAWLGEIRKAGSPKPAAQKSVSTYNKFLAYCIEPHPNTYLVAEERLDFIMRVGNHNKTGFSIEANIASADPSRPTKYLVSEDIPICSSYLQRKRNHNEWGGASLLEGGGWDDILIPALATGRLFFGNRESRNRASIPYAQLTEGPPIPVEPSWELLASGEIRPSLKFPSLEIRLVPTQPLRYLDTANHLLGSLQSELPAALLKAWVNGPSFPPDCIPDLNRSLATISPEHPLPPAADNNARILTGLAPTPCLHVTEVMVGVFLKRHLGGVLKFRYPGSPSLFPLGKDSPVNTVWLDGESRIILERDPKAERVFARDLSRFGLTPLHEFIPDYELNDKNRHSVILKDHLKATAAEWLEFIDSPACAALKDAGWTIETDPKLGLTVHDIREFFPAIEADTARGIDWFRFDVTGEFDGKCVSLIPHIARAIREDWHLRYQDSEHPPETLLLPCDKPADGHIRFPAKRFLDMLEQVRHLFHGIPQGDGPLHIDRLGAASVADALSINSSATTRALAALGHNLRHIQGLPATAVPTTILAELRHYQTDGFRWLQFLADHGLHGILADDMGLGKTLQTLAHLAAQQAKFPGKPSLVIAPTSVVPNWAAETAKFAPAMTFLVLHGSDRADHYERIPSVDVVFTSYPLLVRDFAELSKHHWHVMVLDEAQYIKNPKALAAVCACKLTADHRLCLSGTPMENHLGELWSLLRFLMPGLLADEKSFNAFIRKPIEREHSRHTQNALNRRVSPLILRRTKDQVATELPPKTTLVHGIVLNPQQTDLYESVRAAMDERVRHAISSKGLAKSHIIVLDALLKLRQICCHPQLLKSEAAQSCTESAKLDYLTKELLPTLLEEGRHILLFSQFTSMLALIEKHLVRKKIPFLKLTGQTQDRASLVTQFQSGEFPIFLISLKAGGTGLNLTAADTVIHYDPWWNPAAENQATDRAHRIGQTKPVFVHKLVCRGTIEDRILDLQKHKAALVEALLSEETTKLRIDAETLSHLFAPLQ